MQLTLSKMALTVWCKSCIMFKNTIVVARHDNSKN